MRYDVTFHPSWWHRYAGIAFGSAFFDDWRYRVEMDVRMRRFLYDCFGAYGLGEKQPAPRPLLGSDLLACGYLHSEMLGCAVRYRDDSSPEVLCARLSEKEAQDLHAPELDRSPAWRRMQRQIDAMTNSFGYFLPFVNLMGVQNIALDLRAEALFIDYLDNEALARHLLRVARETCVAVGTRLRKGRGCCSAGVTAIVAQAAPEVYLTSNCSVDMISAATYDRYLYAEDVALAGAVGPLGIHHCGGSTERLAASYARVPGLRFVEIGAGSNVGACASALPGVRLGLRYSPAALAAEDTQATMAGVRALCAPVRGRAGISVSCVGIDAQVSPERAEAFLAACRREDAERKGSRA